jgi:hypothetical protein
MADPMAAQSMPDGHPNDPTVTTLEQPGANVTPESIAAAQAARRGEPVS